METLDRKNAYEHEVTLSASKSLLSETLKLGLAAVLGLNDFDSLLKPTVDYSISDQLNFGCGAFIFIPGPDRDGEKHEGNYGKYKDLGTFFVSAKFSF